MPPPTVLLVLAIGKAKAQVVLESVGPENSIRNWRGSEGVHHIPKRKLENLIVADFGLKLKRDCPRPSQGGF